MRIYVRKVMENWLMKRNYSNDKELHSNRDSNNSPTSPDKMLDKEVLSKLLHLKWLIGQQDTKCWEVGDVCIDLLENNKISPGQIAQYTSYSKTRISHFHLTCRTFPKNHREGYTFQDSLTARQIFKCLPRLNMTPEQIRDEVVLIRNKTARNVKEHFVGILTQKEMKQHMEREAIGMPDDQGLLNHCHHADWRQIVPQLPDQSVQLFLCDPPYASTIGYLSKLGDTSVLRTDCDCGSTEQETLAVTLPLFELCHRKMAPDGMLLLFQAGGIPDRIEVLQKAHECGWEALNALTWNKGHLSVGNFTKPYLICSERILVFGLKGSKPKKFQDGLPHSDILNYSTDTQRATKRMHAGRMEYKDYHMFQKPPELMEFLVQHHSFPGDLVVEPFGCSGACVIAAARLNRQWVYIESNKNNFTWGSQRVLKSVSEPSIQAG
jgi:DNA modification methylase